MIGAQAVDELAKSAKEVLQVAKDAIETLSNFQIQGIEFGASGLESRVSIGITILLNAKIKEYQLEYNLEGSSAAAMAKASCTPDGCAVACCDKVCLASRNRLTRFSSS